VAFGAELAISFVLMATVLTVSSGPWARATGICAAALVASYIFFEAPYSGMSMNPARTLGSAIPAGTWTALWVYFTAPPLGMLLAAEAHRRLSGRAHCAKLQHENRRRCIFCNREADGAQSAAA
jgi:aquaporin Z